MNHIRFLLCTIHLLLYFSPSHTLLTVVLLRPLILTLSHWNSSLSLVQVLLPRLASHEFHRLCFSILLGVRYILIACSSAFQLPSTVVVHSPFHHFVLRVFAFLLPCVFLQFPSMSYTCSCNFRAFVELLEDLCRPFHISSMHRISVQFSFVYCFVGNSSTLCCCRFVVFHFLHIRRVVECFYFRLGGCSVYFSFSAFLEMCFSEVVIHFRLYAQLASSITDDIISRREKSINH